MLGRLSTSYHTDISPSAKHNPIHGGVGVYIPTGNGHALLGTIACTAVETKTKKNVILSNQHAFFPTINGKRLPAGTLISQRGGGAIGKTYKTIAENNQFVKGRGAEQLPKLHPYHDSALAEATVPITNWINGIGPVNGIANPKNGMKIKYFGATSGLQKGTISDASYNTITPTTFEGKPVVERVYKAMIAMDINVDPGDSGSLVLSDPDNRAVGLLWGNEKTTGSKSLAGNIAYIAKVYGIEIGGQAPPATTPTPTPTPVPVPVPVPTTPTSKIQDILLKEIDVAGYKAPVWMLGGGVLATMTILMIATAHRR